MISPQALMRGLVSRILPVLNLDSQSTDVAQRFGRYGEGAVLSYIRKSHLLADEGSYFVTNNAQTGVATNIGLTFSATAPLLIVQNMDSSGGKRIYLDYATLFTTLAGSAASTLSYIAMSVVIDQGLRFSAGGSSLTANIQSPNMDVINAKSVAAVYFGALTATAASAIARSICGIRTLRPTASGAILDVVGETKILNFGGVEGGMFATYSTLTAINSSVQSLPPIVIGPQQSALIYYWLPGATTPVTANYAPEIGWWER